MDKREAKKFVAQIVADMSENISEDFLEIYITRYERKNETRLYETDRVRIKTALKELTQELLRKTVKENDI